MGLTGPLEIEWRSYIWDLNHNGILLVNEDDILAWAWNGASGVLTTKLGYEALSVVNGILDIKYWFLVVSKMKYPLKVHLFIWLDLENRILTWDKVRGEGGKG